MHRSVNLHYVVGMPFIVVIAFRELSRPKENKYEE